MKKKNKKNTTHKRSDKSGAHRRSDTKGRNYNLRGSNARRRSKIVEVEGVFSYSGRGFGFIVPDDVYGVDDIFVSPRKTAGAMTGDRVKASVRVESDGRLAGEVSEVTYSLSSMIGVLRVERGYAYLIPDRMRLGVIAYVPISNVEKMGAQDGFKVEIVPHGEEFFTRTRSITVRGGREMPYFDTEGRISRVFGPALDRNANYAAILHSSGIRTEFPESVIEHAVESASQEKKPDGRVDLRGKYIFTIDGAGAKDLDDAISLERDADGNLELGVHIADVSHYVRQGTPTEVEARERGTSVYFTDKVVPMLPEALSNDACSLNAETDKYALSAIITLDREGRRLRTRVFKSIMRSVMRGVYSEINSVLENGKDSEFFEKYEFLYPTLCEMRDLYATLAQRSRERGALELDDAEAVIILDDSGSPCEIARRERGDAERMIEQFMLQANMGVAELLEGLSLPCLYRIHEMPDSDKLKSFAVFAHNANISTDGIMSPSGEMTDLSAHALSMRLSEMLDEAERVGKGGIISSVLLRSMMKAKYQSRCFMHFGLGARCYCHFTSPIRRYPDLFVHTVITDVLEKCGLCELTASSEIPKGCVASLESVSHERAVSSTDAEIRAVEAERAIEDMYMTVYMSAHIGEVFDVTVCSVIRSGMFVQCDNLVEGFVPALHFPSCRINDEMMTLECGGRLYTLGTRMRVRLAEADVSTSKITFEPAFEVTGT